MLSQKYSDQTLSSILIPRDQWHPFPTAQGRDQWQALPEAVRNVHITRGEDALNFDWPALPAIRFLDYARDGNRSRFQNIRNIRRDTLANLIIAECLEGQGRFLDDITNGIWCICEESFWGVPAHIGVQKAGKGLPDITEPIIDLFAAETSALLAWISYLLAPQLDTVSPLIVPRIEHEIQYRILTPLLERDDFGWMGFSGSRVNNWNPWICSNWLASTLLIEQDETRRIASVAKAMRTVDNFVDPYPKDGGCDEGPGYWGRAGASLYDCLELLHSATDGQIDIYDDPLIQNIGKFIYRVQISDRYFINFADASALITPSFANTYGYGKRINDPEMMALGAWSAALQDVSQKGVTESFSSPTRVLPALFSLPEILGIDASLPLPRDVFLETIEVFVARDQAGSTDGFFVAAKGGHNAESHNHNDIGHVVVYKDGKPILVDAGVETYTAKTFSGDRYAIWTMQSAYHTLPTVNGHQQIPGRTYTDGGIEYQYDIAARNVSHQSNDQSVEFTLDIAKAYPPEANIETWVRSVCFNRGQDIILTDRYHLKAVTGDLTFNLLTACHPETVGPGVLALRETALADGRVSGTAQIQYDADLLDVTFEPVPIEDSRLKTVWGDRLTRIVLTVKTPSTQGVWTVRITS